jgi:hypothetical protein
MLFYFLDKLACFYPHLNVQTAMYIAPQERQHLLKCEGGGSQKSFQNIATNLRREFKLEDRIFLDTVHFWY